MKKRILVIGNTLLVLCTMSCQSGDSDDRTLASTHPKLEKQLERDSIRMPVTSEENPELYQRYRITAEQLETVSEYNVSDIFGGKMPPLDLNSHPEASNFRAALRKGMEEGVNFAGKYTIVTTGCGTDCQQHYIVDRETGKITDKIQSSVGLRYSRNNRTLIVNPPDSAIKYKDCPHCTPKAYVLENGKLQKIETNKKQ